MVIFKIEGSEDECWRLREEILNQERQREEEKAAHRRAMSELQLEVESGCARVSRLEEALQQCRVELEGHVGRVREDASRHKAQIKQTRSQVC